MIKRKLSLSQVTPGMKLAEPITNASGITLMPAGIRLTPMFIVRLKKWNIDTIEVFLDRPKDKATNNATQARMPKSSNTSPTALAAAHGEFAREIAEEVNTWFSNVRENPVMMQLRAVAIKRLVAHGRAGMINAMRRAPGSATKAEGME